jgi:hypothetical protein
LDIVSEGFCIDVHLDAVRTCVLKAAITLVAQTGAQLSSFQSEVPLNAGHRRRYRQYGCRIAARDNRSHHSQRVISTIVDTFP